MVRAAYGVCYLTGYADGFGATFDDAYLVKCDSTGIKIWSRTITSNNSDAGNSLALDTAENILVGGRTLGINGTNTIPKGFISKISKTGVHMWTKVLHDIYEVVSLVPTA